MADEKKIALTDEQIEHIVERVTERVIENVYISVGKGVVKKAFLSIISIYLRSFICYTEIYFP